MMEHPELTDERRERIAARCSEQLASMLADVKGWYPEGALTSENLKREHGNFCSRLGSLASDMGYASFVELLYNEGFDIELDRRAAKNPVGHRIAPEDAVESIVTSVTGRLGSYFEKVDEWYPDRVVTSFAKLHNKTRENLSRQALALGYESWADLLRDYGYEVTDSTKGGAPKTVDPVAIVDELARRYEGREPAPDINTLSAENPDLAKKFSSIKNQSQAVFGMAFAKVLAARGIVVSKHVSREDADTFLAELENAYAQRDDKPAKLKDLCDAESLLHPEWGKFFSSIYTWSKEYYGKTPGELLNEHGIIAGGSPRAKRKPDISEREIEALIDRLREKYAHAVRPRSIGEFADANPEWKDSSRAIKHYLEGRGLGTPAQFLASEELISKIVREDSIARPDEGVLSAFLSDVSASAVDLQQGAPGSTITEFDSRVIGDERYGTPPAYEMLRVGDFVELTVSEDAYVHVGFCGYDLGLIGMDERVEYRLVSRVRNAREWGIVGGRVYAQVTEITGGQKKPRANLHVFFVEDKSAMSVDNGLLMSLDGKVVLDCIDKKSGMLTIAEGVTAIGSEAFADQNISAVSLPSTLREIGRKAFYRTGIRKVTIPSGVKSIGMRAFTHGVEYPSYSSPGEVWRHDDGPIEIEVEGGCERYESKAGSLIELDGADRRLLSLYYSRPSGGSATITVPRGVTTLGPSCIEEYDNTWDACLKMPEGVIRLEAGCLDGIGIGRSTLPASLVDIDPLVWLELCGQSIGPDVIDAAEKSEEPLALFPPSRLRIAKGNPRYSVRGGKAYALPVERLADGSIRVLAGAGEELEDVEPAECFDEVRFQYSGKGGSGFSYSFKFSRDLDNDRSITAEYLEWL